MYKESIELILGILIMVAILIGSTYILVTTPVSEGGLQLDHKQKQESALRLNLIVSKREP